MSRKRRHYQNSEAGDERPEGDFESFDEDQEDTGRSRMAREAKIGLGVIFILLVVFAAVTYNRLTSADDGLEASAATTGSGAEAKETADTKEPDPQSLAPRWTGATVSANNGSDDLVQDDPSTGPASWGAVGEVEQTGESSHRFPVPSSPPSFPPKLVSAPTADRYAGYRGMQTADSPAGASQAGQTAGTPSTDDQPYDRSPRSPSQTAREHDQPGTSDVADAGGPDLAGDQGVRTSPPDPRQPSGWGQWSGQQNPLRGETGGAEQSADAGLPQSSGEAGYAYQPPQSLRDRAAEASVPAPIAGPPATFQAVPRPSPGTSQAEPSSSSSRQSNLTQQYPSSRVSLPTDTARQWASDSDATQADPTRPSLASQPTGLSHLGRQDTVVSSPGKNGTYVVQPNDNYWAISQKLYGTGAYFKALAHHNRAKVPAPDRLRLGDEILAPTATALYEAYPDLCPKPAHREARERRTLAGGTHAPIDGGRVYVVQEGDNLFNIARYELGKATRWTEIVTLNKDRLGTSLNDLNYLTPGMKLLLPDDPPTANIGQRPASRYQR